MKTSGRGSRNSISFAPKVAKANDSQSRRSVSSLNLDNSERNSNDALFDTLMSDPIKRMMIMKLLSDERKNIETYKQNEDKKVVKLKRNERLLHCESPTALLRRRALEKNRRDSESSSTTSDSRSTTNSTIPFERLLKGVVAYVEIRSKDGDRSSGAKALMQAMGATVKDHFNAEVTHVIFKDGSFTTYQKAKLKKVHLVSVLWLEAVRKNNFRVLEKNYPALGTEAFDANITQICVDYERVVNEERRRSRAMGLASPLNECIRSRKTALPSELKSIQYDVNTASPTASIRLSDVIIPTSQDWEAESVISCASGTLPFRRTIPTVPEEESDREIVSPELTSDNDSDCGIINGHSVKRDSSGLDLDMLEKVQNEPQVKNVSSATSTNTSSTRSVSLISRKSGNRKSSYQVIDMDLTTNLPENLDKENKKSRKSATAKKAKRDSILLSDNSTNLLDEITATNSKHPRNSSRKSTYNKSDRFSLPPNDKLFKEPYVDLGNIVMKSHSAENIFISSSGKCTNPVRATRSTSELIGKKQTQKNHSVSNDETPSLRFSSSSKDTTNNSKCVQLTEISEGSTNQKNQGNHSSNSDEMPSLRISTSVDTSSKRHCNPQLWSEPQASQSPCTEEMPSLRISSSSSHDILGKQKNDNHNSRSCSLASEDMPSLRISDSASDIIERRITRSSKSASPYTVDKEIEAKGCQKNVPSKKSVRKKRNSKSPLKIDLESQSDNSRDGTPALKKKRKSESPEHGEEQNRTVSISKDIQASDKVPNNQDDGEREIERNDLRLSQKPSIVTSDSRTSKEMPSLRISTGDCNEMARPKKDNPKQLGENSTKKLKSVGSLQRIVHDITPISTTQNKNSSCNEDQWDGIICEDISNLEDANQAKKRIHNLDHEKYLNNESNLIDMTRLDTSKPNQEGQQDRNDNNGKKKLENKKKNERAKKIEENKKFRKLYNLNQSVEQTLKNFEWRDSTETKGDPSTSNNVVPKKTTTVTLAPIVVTPFVKKLLERRKNLGTPVKKAKVLKNKKNPLKPRKKMLLNASKDEQKELADEYVNKTIKRKVDANEECESEHKRSARISRRSQRLSQCQKQNYRENSSNELITPELNRRSTYEFIQTSPTKTQKRGTQRNRKKITSIVCTRMHKPEVQTFMQIVKKLGSFFVEDEVSSKTTHLVVGEPKRTINLLKALARGSWILKQEWLFRSLEAEKWLPEEDFEVTDFSPAIQQCRVERWAFGSMYSMDIFENCGPIYIARSSIPRRSDLQELVQLCKGTVTNNTYNANVVVGEWVRYENVACVTEMWILDSITFNKRKSFKHYFIKRDS